MPNTAGCAINRRFTYVKWSTLIQGEVKEHYASFDIEYPIIKLDNEPKAYLNCIASGCRASDSRIFLRQKLWLFYAMTSFRDPPMSFRASYLVLGSNLVKVTSSLRPWFNLFDWHGAASLLIFWPLLGERGIVPFEKSVWSMKTLKFPLIIYVIWISGVKGSQNHFSPLVAPSQT